jgi:hypothetical protein
MKLFEVVILFESDKLFNNLTINDLKDQKKQLTLKDASLKIEYNHIFNTMFGGVWSDESHKHKRSRAIDAARGNIQLQLHDINKLLTQAKKDSIKDTAPKENSGWNAKESSPSRFYISPYNKQTIDNPYSATSSTPSFIGVPNADGFDGIRVKQFTEINKALLRNNQQPLQIVYQQNLNTVHNKYRQHVAFSMNGWFIWTVDSEKMTNSNDIIIFGNRYATHHFISMTPDQQAKAFKKDAINT